MAKAIEQARGDPRVHKVGAVIVKEGRLIAEAHGGEEDRTHAELLAIQKAIRQSEDIRDATLYTTLEPCVPDARRPGRQPCAVEIANCDIRRIVIGVLDPNPQVRRRGLNMLQGPMTEVVLCSALDLNRQIRELNEDFFRTEWPKFSDFPGFPLDTPFHGRTTEREELTHWLCRRGRFGDVPILTLFGIGGTGKSSLTWVWARRDVADEEVPGLPEDPAEISARCRVEDGWRRGLRILWFSYYAYEGGGDFNRFLEEALVHFSAGTQVPEDFIADGRTDYREVAQAVLRLLRTQRSLIIWDGAERLLREYSSSDAGLKEERTLAEVEADRASLRCVELRVAQFLWGLCGQKSCKLLLSSRLPLDDLAGKAGSAILKLRGLIPEDAVRMLRSRGLRGPDSVLTAAAEWIEGHPLSLANLAASLQEDFQQTADITWSEFFDPALPRDERRMHVLKRAYERRALHRRELLSRIAALRGGATEPLVAYLAQAIPGANPQELGRDLAELARHGLLHKLPSLPVRFDLHPVVRRYAYSRLSDKRSVHAQLAVYFSRSADDTDIKTARSLAALAPVLEFYHHLARSGNTVEAFRLWKGIRHPRLGSVVLTQFAAYRVAAELLETLFPEGVDALPAVREEHRPLALNDLAIAYDKLGRTRRATDLLRWAIKLQVQLIAKYGDQFQVLGQDTLAMAHEHLGMIEMSLGNLATAGQELAWVAKRHANRHNNVGRVVITVARAELLVRLGRVKRALRLINETRSIFGEELVVLERLRIAILTEDRAAVSKLAAKVDEAFEYYYNLAGKAEEARVERDYLLGAAARLRDALGTADTYLTQALTHSRRLGWLTMEVDSLLELGRLALSKARAESTPARAAMELDSAEIYAQNALEIVRWCEYRLQEIDAHILLSRIYGERGDHEPAAASAGLARELSACGVNPTESEYYYRRGYEEAGELLVRNQSAQSTPNIL